MRKLKHRQFPKFIAAVGVSLLVVFVLGNSLTYAAPVCGDTASGCGSSTSSTSSQSAPTNTGGNRTTAAVAAHHKCGGDPYVDTAIDIGCRGQGNPIMDMLFAVLRLLSDGVGLVIVGSIIFGGIQYTMSAGDPQATAKAVGRIRATLIALLLYIFAYPLLNWIIPAGFF